MAKRGYGANRRGSLGLLRAAVVLSLVLVGGCKKKQPPATTLLAWEQLPAVPTSGPNGWSQISARVNEQGQLDRDTALRAFAMAYGTVPGVTDAPRADQSLPRCGNPIYHALSHHRSALSDAQRAAVDRVFHVRRPRGRAAAIIEALYDDENMGIGERVTHRAKVDQVTSMLRQVAQTIEQRAGHTLQMTVKVQLNYDAGAAPATAIGDFELGYGHSEPDELRRPTRQTPFCRVVVNPAWLNNPSILRMIAGHEYFHCLQFETFQGTWAEYESLPIWVFEGPAAYAGESLAGPTNADGWWWQEYFNPVNRGGTRATHTGEESLSGAHYQLLRSGYDSIGFFASLASAGADLWAPQAGARQSRLLSLVNARSGSQAFAQALGWHPDAATSVASAASRQSYSRAWDLRDSTLQADLPAPRQREFARQRTPINAAAMHHGVLQGEMALIEATASNGPLVKITAGGAGRVRVGDFEEAFWTGTYERYLCRTPPCTCPNGRPPLVQAPVVPSDATYRFAVMGTVDSSHVSAESAELSSVCPPDQPPADLDPCLVGTWRLDPDSFRQAFVGAFGNPGGNIQLDSITENLTITPQRVMTIDIPAINASGGTGGARINVNVTAHFEGRVGTAGSTLVARPTREPVASGQLRVTAAGAPPLVQPLPEAAMGMLRSQATMSGRYTCTRAPAVFVFTPATGPALRFVR
jgi:hypothetical protein